MACVANPTILGALAAWRTLREPACDICHKVSYPNG